MNRRGFLSSCLALGMAPAIVRADSLMRVVARDTILLDMYGNRLRLVTDHELFIYNNELQEQHLACLLLNLGID